MVIRRATTNSRFIVYVAFIIFNQELTFHKLNFHFDENIIPLLLFYKQMKQQQWHQHMVDMPWYSQSLHCIVAMAVFAFDIIVAVNLKSIFDLVIHI